MISRVIESPSPVPVCRVVKNGLNTDSRCSGEMPRPVSVISISIQFPDVRVYTPTRPPCGVASMAFMRRLMSAWWIISASARTLACDGSRRASMRTPPLSAVGCTSRIARSARSFALTGASAGIAGRAKGSNSRIAPCTRRICARAATPDVETGRDADNRILDFVRDSARQLAHRGELRGTLDLSLVQLAHVVGRVGERGGHLVERMTEFSYLVASVVLH